MIDAIRDTLAPAIAPDQEQLLAVRAELARSIDWIRGLIEEHIAHFLDGEKKPWRSRPEFCSIEDGKEVEPLRDIDAQLAHIARLLSTETTLASIRQRFMAILLFERPLNGRRAQRLIYAQLLWNKAFESLREPSMKS